MMASHTVYTSLKMRLDSMIAITLLCILIVAIGAKMELKENQRLSYIFDRRISIKR